MYAFHLIAWILAGGLVAAFHLNLLRSHVRPEVAYMTAISAAIVAGGVTLKAALMLAVGNTLVITTMAAAVIGVAVLLIQESITKRTEA